MKLRAPSIHITLIASYLFGFAVVAEAQRGIRGQIFLPNGAPAQKVIRFTVTTDDGARTDIYFTDSNGRIAMPAIGGSYKITVESDGESYDTTVASFDSRYSGSHIAVNLRPLTAKAPSPPGEININELNKDVSPKAKEAYDSALSFIQSGQYEQAIEPLKQAISLQKNYFLAYTDLGVAYMQLNRLKEAEETLRQAIKINDKMYLPQLNLGIVLNKQGRYKEAAETLSKLRQRHPDQTKIHAPLIEALIGTQAWAEAEAAIKKALADKEADVVDLKVKMGMVEMRQGKFDAAVAALREAVALEPDNALAQFNLGAALLQKGSLDEAEAALRRAYEIKGGQMGGAQLLLGQLYFQKKDYEKALQAFETYLRDIPDAPNAAQVKEAIRQLREALKKQ